MSMVLMVRQQTIERCFKQTKYYVITGWQDYNYHRLNDRIEWFCDLAGSKVCTSVPFHQLQHHYCRTKVSILCVSNYVCHVCAACETNCTTTKRLRQHISTWIRNCANVRVNIQHNHHGPWSIAKQPAHEQLSVIMNVHQGAWRLELNYAVARKCSKAWPCNLCMYMLPYSSCRIELNSDMHRWAYEPDQFSQVIHSVWKRFCVY